MISILLLFLSLLFILVAAEFFTNGVEALGRHFSLSQAVVGSVLAAVGTALPETILPMVAIFFASGHASHEIGVGAILGAPFMLTTLGFLMCGLGAAVSFFRKKRKFEIHAEIRTMRRDLVFFIVMYGSAVLGPIVLGHAFAVPIAVLLILGYVFYVRRTANAESSGLEHYEGLHFLVFHNRIRKTKLDFPHILMIIGQIALALLIMVIGAEMFVTSLGKLSLKFGMNPLLFALLLAPVATELPEKVNSFTWMLKKKDTLALGNITGAMVFQSTFPVSIGLMFTEWQVTGLALFSAVIALTSAIVLLAQVMWKKRITPLTLIMGGAFYLVYAITLIVQK